MKKNTVALIAIISGLAVFIIKLFAYFISNSIALLSDALESIVNIMASCMMFFSIRLSEKPADDSHKYGHQKIEDISSGFEGVLIIAAAILIITAATDRLLAPVSFLDVNLGILVSVVATCINLGVSILLSRAAKSSGSLALEGDAKHLLSDVVSTLGVWIGLIIAQLTGWYVMDALLAFAVAVIITRMGLGLLFRSLKRLMDQACVEEEEIIKSILERQKPGIIEYHDLKTRRQGNYVLAEIHMTVEDTMSVRSAHDIVDQIEEELKKEAPQISIIFHIDPESELPS